MNGKWNFMRLLRGGIALWAFWEVFRTGEWVLLIPAVLFGMQAVLNVGCCGTAGCATPPPRQNTQQADAESVTYEEVR